MTSKVIAPIEIGTFTASTPQKTEFIGSASGVFFVNTVFRAFARSASSASHDVSRAYGEYPSQTGDHGSVGSRLIDPDTPARPEDESPAMRIELDNSAPRASDASTRKYGIRGHGLGIAPCQETAQELLKIYLRNWHPLFPFLHGPSLLDTILSIYEHDSTPLTQPQALLRSRLCQAVICQCVFNIAALDWNGQQLAVESCIESPSQLLSLLGFLASNHDTQSIQALLAAQLYLVCTMSLRAASTIGGTLTRVIYHAGLHRCPARYAQIPPQEGDIRKRIFWSAYILDRFLSQSLGHPLSIQDSDVDVCIPGLAELHKRVTARMRDRTAASISESEVLDHLPQGHLSDPRDPERQQTQTPPILNEDSLRDVGKRSPPAQSSKSHQDRAEASEILGHYVLYCQLTGQALELLHKSIQNRTINRESVLEIQSNVHAWWNELPRRLQEEYSGGKMELSSTFTFFFISIYNQLLLLINRPFLSLPPHSLEFRTSLQSCISAARQIITTSRHQSEWDLVVSWPGMLSTKWMAGLVLSFACTLSLYPFSKAQQEIEDCIQQLMAIDRKWNNARHCAAALRSLLEHLRSQHDGTSRERLAEPITTSLTANMGMGRKHLSDTSSVLGAEAEEGIQPTKRFRQTVDNGVASTLKAPSHGLLENSQSVHEDSADAATRPSRRAGLGAPSLLPSTGDSHLSFGFEDGKGLYGDVGDLFGVPGASDLYGNISGGFGNIGWESIANNWDSLQDWSTWGMSNLRD